MLEQNQLFFKGNQVAFVRRRFAARRRKLGKLKKLSAIKKSKDKESRWMKDQNHKISRQIVNFALTNVVGIIRMEDLTEIQNRAKSKNTSQTCKCGHREKANRNSIQFRCKKCGDTYHADLNGAIHIAKAISG